MSGNPSQQAWRTYKNGFAPNTPFFLFSLRTPMSILAHDSHTVGRPARPVHQARVQPLSHPSHPFYSQYYGSWAQRGVGGHQAGVPGAPRAPHVPPHTASPPALGGTFLP